MRRAACESHSTIRAAPRREGSLKMGDYIILRELGETRGPSAKWASDAGFLRVIPVTYATREVAAL
jgi:hypothetical protein